MQRFDGDAIAAGGAHDGIDLRPGGRGADVRTEPSESVQAVPGGGQRLLGPDVEREKELGLFGARKDGARGEDADDHNRHVLNLNHASKDGGIRAQVPSPERIADDRYLFPASEILGRLEGAAARGEDPQRSKDAGAHAGRPDGSDSGWRGNGVPAGIERGDGLDRLRALFELEEFHRPHGRALTRAVDRDQLDQSIRGAVGQGTQQRRIDDAEDRGAAAYADGQRQNRDRGEAWIAREAAHAMAQIREKATHARRLHRASQAPSVRSAPPSDWSLWPVLEADGIAQRSAGSGERRGVGGMAPTDADKIALLVSALDRLILTMQYGKYQDKIEALLAAAEAKRVAQVTGPLSEAEIADVRGAPAANEAAMEKLVPVFARLAEELLDLRRRDADHVFREKVLNDRIREFERQSKPS